MAKAEEITVKVKAETAVKPGWKSTEFYFSAAATVIGLLLASGVIEAGSAWDKVIGLVASALVAMGYTVQRTIAKNNGGGK